MLKLLVVSNNPGYVNELKRAALVSDAEIIAICFDIADVRRSLMSGVQIDAIIASDILPPGTSVQTLLQEFQMANVLNKVYFVLHNPDFADMLMAQRIQYVFEDSTPPQDLLNQLHREFNATNEPYNPYSQNPYAQNSNGNPYMTNNMGPGAMNPGEAPYQTNNRQYKERSQQNMAKQFVTAQQNPFVNNGGTGSRASFKPIMVTINSPKGGVGKTSIAIELAFTIAKQAKQVNYNPTSKIANSQNVSVCLADFNPSFDTMAATMNCVRYVTDFPTVTEWVNKIEEKIFDYMTQEEKVELMSKEPHDFAPYIREDQIRFTREEIESLLVQDEETGLYLLPSIALPFDVEYVKPEYLKIILKQLRAVFDVVIVDTGNNISFFSIVPMRESNAVLLVTSPTAGSSVALGKLTKNFDTLQLDRSKFNLVINNPNGGRGPEIKAEAISSVLNLPVVATLPYEEEIKTAHERGVPYCISHHKSPFTKALVKLASQLCPLWDPVVKRNKKKGFF